MKFLFAASAAIAAIAGTAEAQVPQAEIYGSLGYNKKQDSDLDAVQLRLGARFHRYFGVEVEGGKGVEPNTLILPSLPPIQIKRQLRHELAAYAVGYLPLSPNADLYARVGYGNSWFKTTFAQAPNLAVSKGDNDSINYGVGGQYFLDGKNGVRADYTRQDYGGRLGADDTWSVAYTRRF